MGKERASGRGAGGGDRRPKARPLGQMLTQLRAPGPRGAREALAPPPAWGFSQRWGEGAWASSPQCLSLRLGLQEEHRDSPGAARTGWGTAPQRPPGGVGGVPSAGSSSQQMETRPQKRAGPRALHSSRENPAAHYKVPQPTLKAVPNLQEQEGDQAAQTRQQWPWAAGMVLSSLCSEPPSLWAHPPPQAFWSGEGELPAKPGQSCIPGLGSGSRRAGQTGLPLSHHVHFWRLSTDSSTHGPGTHDGGWCGGHTVWLPPPFTPSFIHSFIHFTPSVSCQMSVMRLPATEHLGAGGTKGHRAGSVLVLWGSQPRDGDRYPLRCDTCYDQ